MPIDREKRRQLALLEPDSVRRNVEINRIEAAYHLECSVAHAYLAVHGTIPDAATQQRLVGKLADSIYDAVITTKP
jgi:hypothetical protein